MKPIIKWTGGKASELNIIRDYLPSSIDTYYEPFLGGGAVYFDLVDSNIEHFCVNDRSKELINFYMFTKNQNKEFLTFLQEINKSWIDIADFVYKNSERLIYQCVNNAETIINLEDKNELISITNNSLLYEKDKFISDFEKILKRKLKKQSLDFGNEKQGMLDTVESSIKNAFYTHIRYLYNNRNLFLLNDSLSSALFFFIREYCYSSMFRYNSKGEFNVPYGGISYNSKSFGNKINSLSCHSTISHLKRTSFENNDFEEFFLNKKLDCTDFIFLDPPYDTKFSNYSNNDFSKQDHIRLSNFCKEVNSRFMLIIKKTDFIVDLYKDFPILSFEKKVFS